MENSLKEKNSYYIEEVIVYPINKKENKVLLIHKKRGLGSGLYNGPGGKVHKNETAKEAAIRECEEEIGIKPITLNHKATIEFINNKYEKILVHVFVTYKWRGKPKETDEAKPIWFDINALPYQNMWEDDIYWLPYVLKDNEIYAIFEFKKWKLIRKKVYFLNEVK